MGTRSKLLAAIGAGAVLAGGGVGVAHAVGGNSDYDQATGPAADKAKAAAIKAVGSGRAVSVERESEAGSAWEVEVARPDATEVETSLDSAYKSVGVERKDDGSDDDRASGAAADKAKAAAIKAVGSGRAVSVEREREAGSAWEVEVVRSDGTEVETSLDSAYKSVGVEREDAGIDDDGEVGDD